MVDRHASEDERHPVAERVRIDAETDPKLGSCHATDANAPGSSASDSIAMAPARGGLEHPPRAAAKVDGDEPRGERRSRIVVGPVADVCDLGGGRADEVDEPLEERRVGLANAEAGRAGHDVDRELGGARPRFERGGLVPGDADEQRPGAQALEAFERVRVQVVGRVDDRFPGAGRHARCRGAARAPSALRSARWSRPAPPTRRAGRARPPRRRHASSAPRRPGSPPRRRRPPARSRAVVLHEPGNELEVVSRSSPSRVAGLPRRPRPDRLPARRARRSRWRPPARRSRPRAGGRRRTPGGSGPPRAPRGRSSRRRCPARRASPCRRWRRLERRRRHPPRAARAGARSLHRRRAAGPRRGRGRRAHPPEPLRARSAPTPPGSLPP